ncbi:Cyclin-T [Araneus ventricosus]|uniref:Cyclin-T n=1 Tax=Araneus ventricosus TaxID=182803 RepID=A0A4Y2FXT7_ARAVE|nr:Cyclin-T [Araneus ventricosus]
MQLSFSEEKSVKASKDLAQTSYIMATTSLHMTTMCLQYKPTIVACVCIHLACKWSSYMIEKCSEGRDWFYYVDKDVTWELLERLTQEFIEILERSPHRFKRKFGKDGSMHVPRPIDNIPGLPGPSGSGSSGTSTSNNNRPTAVPIENKIGIVIKKEKDPSPGPSNAEYINDAKEKKPVVVKKEPESSKQEEKTHLSVPPPQPSISSEHQPASHQALQIPNEHLLGACNESVELPQEKLQPPPPPLPQHQPQPPPPVVHVPNEHSSSKKSSKESLESSSSRKHKSKHASKSKISSSSSNNNSSHSEPTSSGIKVKIRKDIISLSGVDCNQKYTPPVKAESPKKLLKIKLPKPPPPVESPKAEKSSTPTSLKIVLTKDKSGSGSYSTSHRSEHRESRKRSHSSAVPDGSHRDHKNSVEPSIKYPKTEQYQKNHSGDQRPNKVSRHSSSHRSDMDNTHNNASSSRLQYPAVNENSTFQNYSTVPNYQNSYLIPPPPLPKLKGHNMMVGKTNSNFPMQPPLPPPQPPPPPPPPEDI